MKTFRIALSFVYWFIFFWMSFAFLVFVLILRPLTFLFDPHAKLINMTSCLWGTLGIMLNPLWSLEVKNRRAIGWKQTYVIVCNHQSVFDPLVLFALFRPFKWLVKESAFKIPIVGMGMRINRFIMVKRDSRKSRGEALSECRHWLEKKNSVLIFPEGTRSKTGDLQKFQSGAFRLAAEMNLPMVPVLIRGTRDIMPKESKFALGGKAHLTVEVLEAIPAGKYSMDQLDAFREDVHARMAKALEKPTA